MGFFDILGVILFVENVEGKKRIESKQISGKEDD